MRNPVRSDAKRRRRILLDAAAEVFATQGYGAPLDSIAARAGVGQGTFYRNFADREELLTALLDRDLTLLEETLEATEPHAHPVAMIEAMAESAVVNPAMCEYWTALPPDSPLLAPVRNRFLALSARGLEEAKKAGLIRNDLKAEDIGLIGVMFRAIRVGTDEAERREAKARVLSLLLQGIAP